MFIEEPRKSYSVSQLLTSHRSFSADDYQSLSMDEINVMVEYEEEAARKGQFSRVFPLAANVDYYEKFFEEHRYWNLLLWSYLRGGKEGKKIIGKHYKRVFTNYI
jgi:hypothetical protein